MFQFYSLLGFRARDASLCKISSKSVNPLQRYRNFFRWRPSPYWIFKVHFFLPLRFRKANVLQYTRLWQNRSNGFWDIAIFRFSRWRLSAILNLFGAYLDHPRRVLGGLYLCVKFGCDRCSSFDNMNVSVFRAFGLKTPIHAQNWGFREILLRKWRTPRIIIMQEAQLLLGWPTLLSQS